MKKILKIKINKFEGVLIPDHAPQISYDAPLRVGKEYAMGYMIALLSLINNK